MEKQEIIQELEKRFQTFFDQFGREMIQEKTGLFADDELSHQELKKKGKAFLETEILPLITETVLKMSSDCLQEKNIPVTEISFMADLFDYLGQEDCKSITETLFPWHVTQLVKADSFANSLLEKVSREKQANFPQKKFFGRFSKDNLDKANLSTLSTKYAKLLLECCLSIFKRSTQSTVADIKNLKEVESAMTSLESLSIQQIEDLLILCESEILMVGEGNPVALSWNNLKGKLENRLAQFSNQKGSLLNPIQNFQNHIVDAINNEIFPIYEASYSEDNLKQLVLWQRIFTMNVFNSSLKNGLNEYSEEEKKAWCQQLLEKPKEMVDQLLSRYSAIHHCEAKTEQYKKEVQSFTYFSMIKQIVADRFSFSPVFSTDPNLGTSQAFSEPVFDSAASFVDYARTLSPEERHQFLDLLRNYYDTFSSNQKIIKK